MPRVTRDALLRLQRFFVAQRKKPLDPKTYRLGFAVGAELLTLYDERTVKGIIVTALAYNPNADWRFVRKHRDWLKERWEHCGSRLVADFVDTMRAFRHAVESEG